MIMVANLEKAEGGWGRLEPENIVSGCFNFERLVNVVRLIGWWL